MAKPTAAGILAEYKETMRRIFAGRPKVLIRPGYHWLGNDTLPEKMLARDYTSPPRLLAPGEIR